MAFRSYMLTRLTPGLDREQTLAVIHELEGLDAVNFVDSVVGAYDLVVTVETDAPIEEITAQLGRVERVDSVTALKVNPIPPRERMWKNLNKLPRKPRA